MSFMIIHSEVHGVNPTGSPHPTQGHGTAMDTSHGHGHGTPHSPAPLACLVKAAGLRAGVARAGVARTAAVALAVGSVCACRAV